MEGFVLIRSTNASLGKKNIRLSSMDSAWAGKFSPAKTGTSPKGSPGPKI